MAVEKLTLRAFQSTDDADARELWVELTERHRDIYEDPTIGGDDPGAALDGYLDELGDGELWVAERDGAVVGMAGLLIHGDEGEIEPIVVTAEHRSAGVGGRLLEHLIGRARQRSLSALSIRPVARNVAAMRRFHRAGFRTLGHIDMFMDLTGRDWVPGAKIHDLGFEY